MKRAHRLAAIMFTDIQGYTKLMQENEDKAIAIRNRHREIFNSSSAKHRGEILQYYGDGTLSIFESCVDAVRCAIEMQNQFQSSPVIPVRIGIHLGDIVISEEEIIGDSVNIAARVESLGTPGSALISNKVFEEIRNKQEFHTQRLGKFHFKNDKTPRTIYALKGENLVVPRKQDLKGKLEKKGKRRTYAMLSVLFIAAMLLVSYTVVMKTSVFDRPINNLAVMPLNDRIGLAANETYIIEGLHEEIITKLSKVGLNVKPFSTMIPYRTNPKSTEEVGKELNVDALVEGSVFRADSTYTIRIQIVDVATQEYITEPYTSEAEFSNIMTVYSELVESIANMIKYTLSDEAQAYLNQNPTVNSKAYDLYLRGRYHINKGTIADVQNAIDFYNQSLDIDSTFGHSHVSLVESYLLLGFSSNNPSLELDEFRKHLSIAQEIDPFIASDYHLMAMVKVFDNWDWVGAEVELKKAIKGKPKSSDLHDTYCQLMWAMGKMDESIHAGEMAVKLDPNSHYAHCDLGWAYFLDKNYEAAKSQVEKTLQLFGTDCPQHHGLSLFIDMFSKVQIGQSLIPTIDRISREVDSTGYPIFNLSLLGYAHALEGNRDSAYVILRELESKNIPGADKIYIALGEYDKALDMLEASIASRSLTQMYLIKKAPWYDPLRNHPRFDRILTRMGLGDQQLW